MFFYSPRSGFRTGSSFCTKLPPANEFIETVIWRYFFVSKRSVQSNIKRQHGQAKREGGGSVVSKQS